MKYVVLVLALSVPLLAQAPALPSDISAITDDSRCDGKLAGITNPEQALWTGCARFWPKWPAASAPDAQQQEARNRRLLFIWRYAQSSSYGHYAVLYGPGSLRPDQNVARSAIAQGLTSQASPAVTSDIRTKCAKEWLGDFAMRAYCEKRQQDAIATLGARSMASTDQQTIRTMCVREWPDDFAMRNYCEERQLKALATLGR